MAYTGRTIALYGDTGSGKTTLAGEYAKLVRKQRNLDTTLFASDMGGYDSIGALVRYGVIRPVDDPWIWIKNAASGKVLDATDGGDRGIGCAIFDSATSQSEALLLAAAKSDYQIGQQRTQRFNVTKGKETLNVSINNEAHYGVIQSFMLDAIWKSTWLTRKGIDVIWTFSVHRGEEQDRTPILGPKLAGKALTAAIPKWFKYTFRVVSIPQDGVAPLHRLYLTEHQELAGLGHSFGNARYPLDATTPLPAFIEPASIIKAIELIDAGQIEADEALKQELG
jgi:energy-coupling factor transporter ATP-binding protein EcfA2